MAWKQIRDIEELHWDQARDDVYKSDPAFAKIVDDLSPNKDFTLLKISYPFGAVIYQDGTFYLPTKDGFTPMTDKKIPSHIRASLSYSTVPLGFVIENSFEVFREFDDRIFSLAYRTSGLELGIWESFAPGSPFTVTAGSRSLMMLPKISDVTSHKKLKRYGLRSQVPNKSFDQWHVYTELANNSNFHQPWALSFLLFTDKWIEKMKKDPSWIKFESFVMKKFISHTEPARVRVTYDSIWEAFANILQRRRIKPNPYIIDTFKHLISIATGILPAFKAVHKNQKPGPVDELMKIYLEEYGLKTYYPSMMYSDYFNHSDNDSAYYSLQVPTCHDSTSSNRRSTSVRTDLFELVELLDNFTLELTNGNLGAGSSYIFDLFSKIQFDFFHSEEDKDRGVHPPQDIGKEDKNLLYLPEGKFGNREFCDRSSFVRGCVRISKKVIESS